MATSGRSILGVDINPYQIRVVEMRGSGQTAQVLRVGAVPMPRGAIEGDRVVFPDTVAETLRGLLTRMNVGTRHAVIGIGAHSVITRVLDIPRVPDSEIRMVIQGELQHYQILREESGIFDYVRLQEPTQNLEANPQVLLMAIEDRVAAGYREIAERAGLSLVALEPILLAMYRAAFPQIQAQPASACVLLSYGKAEIAIVDHGYIRIYRRVDLGTDDLIVGRQRPRAGRDEPGRERVLLGSEDEPPAESAPEAAGSLRATTAGDLATELQRSLDYYRREYPQASAVGRIILATHDPEVEPLGEWLSEALRIDVVVAEAPVAMGVSRAVSAQLEAPEGIRFVAASGLALHALPASSPLVPRFDLSVREREEAGAEFSRRKLTLSLAFSIAMVLVGLVVTIALTRTADALEHEVETMRSTLGGKQHIEQARIQEMQARIDQLRALKMEGFPFPRIIDAVSSAVDPQTGLTDIQLDRTGRLGLAGLAASEQSVIKTLESLKRCNYFENVSLDNFESTIGSEQRRSVRFQISSQLAGMRPAATPQAHP